MNRLICVLALAVCAHSLPADDGSWSTGRGYVPAEGALYSETGNPDIVMEKEYLELRDVALGSTRAVFQFRNTSRTAVTAECAFPIQFDFDARPVTLDGKGGLAVEETAGSFKAWDFGDLTPSRYAAGQPASPEDKGFVNDVLSALSILTDPWDAEAADVYFGGLYFRDDQYPRARAEVNAAKLRKAFGFTITQDGRELPVPTCVAEFGEEPGHVVLHFRHQLSFAAGATSVVTVTYALPTRSEVSAEPTAPRAPGVRNQYTWNYILQTASSWKDSLGRIVLAVPAGFLKDLPAPWRSLGAVKGRLLFMAENWKPTAEQNLSISWVSTDADLPTFWRQMTEPLDPADMTPAAGPAKLLGASSFLGETADVFLSFGIWRNATFDAARLFDGLPETAWAVRTARGGIGEYVRFSLDAAVSRLDVSNGYQRSTVSFPDKDTWSYYGKNNRVKTLDIVRDDGKTNVTEYRDDGGLAQRLQLADTREVQMFNISLPAGIYRAVISAIYPGSRWNDTCLGELRFSPGTAVGFDALNKDTFFTPFLK